MEAAKPLDWKAYAGAPDVGEAREYYGFFEFGYYVVTKDGGSWSASTFMNDGKAKHVGFFPTLAEAKSAAQSDYHSRLRSAFQPAPAEPVTLTYTNWRGETSARAIIPRYVWFGSTEWHPEPQWLLRATDTEKAAERDFALKDFGAPAALAEFARACVQFAWDGCGLDDSEVEKLATKYGIIEPVAFNPDIHVDPDGFAEPGDEWFAFAPYLQAIPTPDKDQS